MKHISYFTKELLVEANHAALQAGANRTIGIRRVAALPDQRFPVTQGILHNDTAIRCRIILDSTGAIGVLDVPLQTYLNLPHIAISEVKITTETAKVKRGLGTVDANAQTPFEDVP